MGSSAFEPPIFCERCAAAPNAGFLRLTQADGGMAFTGRFSDAERSLTAPLFERANRREAWYPPQTPWPHISRRAAAVRLRAAAEGAERAAAEARGNVSSAADSSLLRSASKAARASRAPPRAASLCGRSAERRLSIWKILQLHGFS